MTTLALKILNKKSRIYGTSDRFAKMNLICQICQRVISVRESDLWGRSVICLRVRSERPCGRPIGLSRTVGDAVRSSAKCIASAGRGATGPGSNAFSRGSDCIARCAWEADRPPTQPLTSDSQTSHVICLRVRSERPIGLSRTPIGLRAKQCV